MTQNILYVYNMDDIVVGFAGGNNHFNLNIKHYCYRGRVSAPIFTSYIGKFNTIILPIYVSLGNLIQFI